MRLPTAVLIASAVACLALPASAGATNYARGTLASADVVGDSRDNNIDAFIAPVSGVQRLFVVEKNGQGITPLGGCQTALFGSVHCPVPRRLSISGGDGNDNLAPAVGEKIDAFRYRVDLQGIKLKLRGGRGDDYLGDGTENDILSGEGGDDYLSHDNGGLDIMRGGPDNDRLVGEGLSSDDQKPGLGMRASGGSGNDVLLNGYGWYYTQGGKRQDVFWPAQVRGVLYGGEGDDYIRGGDASDFLSGDGGDDKVISKGDDQPDDVWCGDNVNGDAAFVESKDTLHGDCERFGSDILPFPF